MIFPFPRREGTAPAGAEGGDRAEGLAGPSQAAGRCDHRGAWCAPTRPASICFRSSASTTCRLRFRKMWSRKRRIFPAAIPASEISRREDFRKIFTMTIDPDDAKDFDDALSYRNLPNGDFEIYIHIADVSHYVYPELCARYRGEDPRATAFILSTASSRCCRKS